MRDLPIPGSPDSSTTRPSPLAACRQRRSSNSSSSSRPISGVVAARNASKRLSTDLVPSTRHAGNRLGEPFEGNVPKVVTVEKAADELAGTRRNHNRIGLGDRLQAPRKLGSFADNPLLIRAIAEEIAKHDGPGGDADPQLKEPGAAAIKLRDRLDQAETGTNRAFDVMLVRLRIAEIAPASPPRKASPPRRRTER